jgi:iron(III) transport system substrate-binding protein
MKRLASLLALTSLAAACTSESGKTTLIVYSPHGAELLGEYESRFEAAHPEVDVRFLDMGSQDALDRIRSERSNPQADVWFGAPSTMFVQAEAESLLEAYRPTWAEAVDADAHSTGDFWYGTYQTPEVIAYNTNALAREDVPRDWDAILDPRWMGRIIIRDPIASGTMRTIFAAMILRNSGPDDWEGGYDWLRRLDRNTREYTLNPTLMLQKMAREEAVLTLWNMPDIELQKNQYGYPLDYVVPESGTPVLTDAIAIVAGTEQVELARSYYEFVTSPESLSLAAELFYRIPSRNDLERASLPEWMRDLEIPRMPMDWDLVSRNTQEWMDYWDDYIRGGR